MKPSRSIALPASVGEYTHHPGFHMDFHRHGTWEIGLVLGGKGHYEVKVAGNIRKVPAEPGMVFLWDGKAPHRAVDDPSSPLRQIILTFQPGPVLSKWTRTADLQAITRNQVPAVLTTPMAFHRVKSLLRDILREQDHPALGTPELMVGWVREILVLFHRSLLNGKGSTPKRDKPSFGKASPSKPKGIGRRPSDDSAHPLSIDGRIADVIRYLSTHAAEPLSTVEVASRVGLSRRRFHQLFRSATGTTFLDAQNRHRMEQARRLLQESTASVTHIAFQVGYEQLPYFTRVFKKMFGMSPMEFRNRT